VRSDAEAEASGNTPRLRCDTPGERLDAQLYLYVGVISTSSEPGHRRRRAARMSWLQHSTVGSSVLVCFVLSSQYPPEAMKRLRAEAARHGDMLFVDAPETPMLITSKTKYSGYTTFGRGMPTFKQYAFFQHAARTLRRVPYIAKVDDDSAVNLRRLRWYLERVRCYPNVLIGSIHFAGFVPRAHWSGVRGDRCGWGWNAYSALQDYERQDGKPGVSGYKPSCLNVGALLPFPFAAGAGYVLSNAAMRYIGSSPLVRRWVADAAGAEHESLQWQKFEDTTTGYWLLYANFSVTYLDINRWMHNGACDPRGQTQRTSGDLRRPASNRSVIVHDLKAGGFGFAWEQMDPPLGVPYDHQRCLRLK